MLVYVRGPAGGCSRDVSILKSSFSLRRCSGAQAGARGFVWRLLERIFKSCDKSSRLSNTKCTQFNDKDRYEADLISSPAHAHEKPHTALGCIWRSDLIGCRTSFQMRPSPTGRRVHFSCGGDWLRILNPGCSMDRNTPVTPCSDLCVLRSHL